MKFLAWLRRNRGFYVGALWAYVWMRHSWLVGMLAMIGADFILSIVIGVLAGLVGDEDSPTLQVETEQEDDGRWLADITTMPGCMAYGSTAEQAAGNAIGIALERQKNRGWYRAR